MLRLYGYHMYKRKKECCVPRLLILCIIRNETNELNPIYANSLAISFEPMATDGNGSANFLCESIFILRFLIYTFQRTTHVNMFLAFTECSDFYSTTFVLK